MTQGFTWNCRAQLHGRPDQANRLGKVMAAKPSLKSTIMPPSFMKKAVDEHFSTAFQSSQQGPYQPPPPPPPLPPPHEPPPEEPLDDDELAGGAAALAVALTRLFDNAVLSACGELKALRARYQSG